MVIFTKVTYKNFLASGNVPIVMELNEQSATLIVGKNGAGKSTMSEAVSFALFGRPLRNVNKPKLVNSINQRECEVELEFRIGQVHYRIKRGIKPNLFEIYENGNLIPPPAAVQDYQTLLETSILHLNYKSFMQVVVLGSASYVPFMRLTTAIRREIIEDLLDIEVFSSMNALMKDDLTTARQEMDKCSQATTLIAEQRRMAQSFTEHIAVTQAAACLNLQGAIAIEKTIIETLEQELVSSKQALSSYDEVRNDHDIAAKKKREYEKTLDVIESRAHKIQKERSFYEEHDTCPTCEQSITEDFKHTRFLSLTSKEEGAAKATAQCQKLITGYQTKIDEVNAQLTEAGTIERTIHGIEAKLPIHQRRVRDLEQELHELSIQKNGTTTVVDIAALDVELDVLRTQHETLSRSRVIMDAANMLLKDNGIKARIIKHYLPIINKQINHYLNAMDFPIQFTLDEEFTEQIKSRHRDVFEYNSFSEGEKKRIDLALLLTWRAVAALKNSAATNLLILDEVFDSSLDSGGTEEFLKIIADLEKETNVFVISHKQDQLVDKFANTIVFEKVRGFSQVKK